MKAYIRDRTRLLGWLCWAGMLILWVGCTRAPKNPSPTAAPARIESQTPTAIHTATATRNRTPPPEPSPTASLTPSATAAAPATSTPAMPAIISPQNASRLEQVGIIRFGEWQLVTSAAWSPDGQILVISAGEQIFLYRGQTKPGEAWVQLAELQVGALTPGLAFSPDSQWLAAGSRDGMVRVWQLSAVLAGSQPPVWQVQAHKKGVNSIRFHPSGDSLASGGNDAVARLWELASGQLLETTVGGSYAVPCVAFSPDGLTLAVVNGTMIRLRQVGSGRITGSFQAEKMLFSAAFNPDGSLLAAGDNHNQVLLWQVDQAYRSGQERYPAPVVLNGHTGRQGSFRALIWQVTYNPDGRILASAGGDGTVWLWDVENKAPLARLVGHSAGVNGVTFSPDGKRLASSGIDQTVRIWGIGE